MSLNIAWDFIFGAPILAVAWWYLREVRASNAVPTWRRVCFTSGLALAFLTLVGPIPHFAIRLFWVHMIQHIALMMLISPLLILGGPVTVALASARPKTVARMRSIGHIRILRWLMKPQIGFFVFLVALIGTHFSPLADAGMKSGNVHCVELVIFSIAGIIYYYPVMSGNPTPEPVSHPTRVGSIFAMMVPETMTGFFLYSSGRLLHDIPPMPGMDMTTIAINDQHLGGVLMWSMGMIIDTAWVVLSARDWFAYEKSREDADEEENV